MHLTALIIILAALICKATGYPPRHAHHRGHIHHHHHEHHHEHHQQNHDNPRTDETITIPVQPQNTTQDPFEKEQNDGGTAKP